MGYLASTFCKALLSPPLLLISFTNIPPDLLDSLSARLGWHDETSSTDRV